MKRPLSKAATFGLWVLLTLEAYLFGVTMATLFLVSRTVAYQAATILTSALLCVLAALAAGTVMLQPDGMRRLPFRRILSTVPKASIAFAVGCALFVLVYLIHP